MQISFDYDLPKYDTRFKLKNHGDRKLFQFIDEDIHSYRCESYHRLSKPKVKLVSCLGGHCQLCKSTNKEIAKVKYTCYIPVYNYVKDKLQIWERPLSWAQETLNRLQNVYGKDNFTNLVFEVIRNGTHNSLDTSYMIHEVSSNGYPPVKLNKQYEKSQIVFDINIETWTSSQQNYYLETYKLPDTYNFV